jgi:hypothetical protein
VRSDLGVALVELGLPGLLLLLRFRRSEQLAGSLAEELLRMSAFQPPAVAVLKLTPV